MRAIVSEAAFVALCFGVARCCWCPVLRWDVRVSSYAAGNGRRGGRSGLMSWLLYLGGLLSWLGLRCLQCAFEYAGFSFGGLFG